MNTTVSGTDDPGQRHVSQIAASSTTQHDECPVTTSDQRITYTTAQLHENLIVKDKVSEIDNGSSPLFFWMCLYKLVNINLFCSKKQQTFKKQNKKTDVEKRIHISG